MKHAAPTHAISEQTDDSARLSPLAASSLQIRPSTLAAALVWVVMVMMLLVILMGASSAWSQNAPGEDPVVLNKRIALQMLPIAAARASTPMETVNDMPAWLKAKVVRFEAKANSDLTTGITTDTDVTRTASSDGLKKTCIQEVGSNTITQNSASQSGKGTAPQIVVLKGDLVNICK